MTKSIISLVKLFLGNSYRHLAIFSGHTASLVRTDRERLGPDREMRVQARKKNQEKISILSLSHSFHVSRKSENESKRERDHFDKIHPALDMTDPLCKNLFQREISSKK